MKSNYLILLIIVAFCWSCTPSKDNGEGITKPKNQAPAVVPAPVFNADSAYRFVEEQVAFGPRVPNTLTHDACAAYIVEFFKKRGVVVQEQQFQSTAFDGTVLNLTNIIASFNPSAPKRILFTAHWDTRPFSDQDDESLWHTPIDGANDGGSGVGVLMEIARTISQAGDLEVGLDIVLFDGEDYGAPHFHQGGSDLESWCLGSQYWSKTPHKPGYRAYYGVLLDMVGAKDATFYKEGVSMDYAPSIVNKVWAAGQKLGFSANFVNAYSDPITDDHAFINRIAQIPTIDIIEYDRQSTNFYFGHYWHTQKDNMEVISKETMNAVGTTLLHVLYQE